MDIVLLTTVLPYQNPARPPPQGTVLNLFRGLGAYQIAWYLRENGYSVQVVDFLKYLSTDQIQDLLADLISEETKVLGLGVLGIPEQDPELFVKFQTILLEARQRWPWITVVGGGPTANRFEQVFSKGTFDWLVIGHAEDTMLALSDHLVRGKASPRFEITAQGTRLLRESSPLEVADKFHIEYSRHRWHARDCIQQGEALPLETTRGCVFKCRFCQYPHIGKRKRDFLRNMDEIKAEILDNYQRFKTTNYYILDDTFNADKDRVQEFWQMTKTLPFKIRYTTYLRLDLIAAHPQTAMMLQESGLVGAFFGIETFNPEAALMIGKSFSGRGAKEFLPRLIHDIWQDKIVCHCGLIAGLPQETFEDLEATNSWMVDNGIGSWSWNPLYINRKFDSASEYFSEFDRHAEKYGFKFEDGSDIWYTETTDLRRAAQWAGQLQAVPDSIGRVGVWAIQELLNYPCMNMDIILNKPVQQFLREYPVQKLRQEWLQRYIDQLRSGS